jgi:ABC-type polysaccharide/polyol phosphate export permease
MSLLISMSLLFVVNIVIGANIGWTWLLVPFILILMQGFGFGLGLILSSLNVFFNDIGQMLGVTIRVWIWLTPIIYTKDILPEKFAIFMNFNPAYPYIDALHNTIVYRELPVNWHWGVMAVYALAAPAIGYLILRKLRPEIRDVI